MIENRIRAMALAFGVLLVVALLAMAAGARPAGNTAGRDLAGKTIAIDPGHNGHNALHPSTINKLVPAGGFRKACDTTGTETADATLTEAAFAFDVARRLRKLLQARGATVVMTRKNNRGVGPCVNRRAAIGNTAHADAAISIHGDGAPAGGHGFHVIRPGLVRGYTRPIVRPSKRLAVDVRDKLAAAKLTTSTYAGRHGLIARTDLAGLNLSKVPKVFVELGNMRNRADERRMERSHWRQKVAAALAGALAKFATR